MSEEEKYSKLQDEYDGNDFFDNMQDCNLALNSLFELLINKDFRIVKYDHDKELILKFTNDLQSDMSIIQILQKWMKELE